MHELQLTKTLDKKFAYHFIHAISALGYSLLNEDDLEQLSYPIDQAYIDFKVGMHIITLHYEHYIGISLLSNTAQESDLRQLHHRFSTLITDKKLQKRLLNPPIFFPHS
ncbi:MAG: hypothetical protein EAY65_03010 [Alphaproteobacteria bacterium]|nr:MAG: hypothetical protein EAY65_03010 [Alphaproteobacteria bacterium]